MLLYAFFSPPGGVILQDYESCVLYLYIPPLFALLFYLKQLRLSPHQSVTQHLLIPTAAFCQETRVFARC